MSVSKRGNHHLSSYCFARYNYSLDKEELYKIVYILKKYNLDGGGITLGAVGFLIVIRIHLGSLLVHSQAHLRISVFHTPL